VIWGCFYGILKHELLLTCGSAFFLLACVWIFIGGVDHSIGDGLVLFVIGVRGTWKKIHGENELGWWYLFEVYYYLSFFFKVPLMFDYKSLFSSLDMLDFKYHDVIDDFLQWLNWFPNIITCCFYNYCWYGFCLCIK
jgi:hypothetical protein